MSRLGFRHSVMPEAGSSIVMDESKASSWASSHPNSSNSQGDRPLRDNEWHKHKKPKGSRNENDYQQDNWNSSSFHNMGNQNNTGNQNPSEVNTEKVKTVRPTLAELLKMELKLLGNYCGWKVDPDSRHARSCLYFAHLI